MPRPSHRDPDAPIRVLHLISDSQPTGYFRLIAKYTDHERFRMQVGSLEPADGLQEGLQEVGIRTFAIGATSRRSYPLAVIRLARRLRKAVALIRLPPGKRSDVRGGIAQSTACVWSDRWLTTACQSSRLVASVA